ncbi:V-type proton ATPase subunit C 1-B [Cyprinodon tularosa]|uniref:V-type proton ATPase subunit C 1-B n=1 Tax=Cyprinodon tularosa TaxID=77115 RepID=UPI0018E240A0|nr:V-type proton ATPase subunit C 1-B [Cyprinodon tularosa]
MAEFWLISVPLDKTSLASMEKLKRTIIKTHLASFWKFFIPDLKVGILDSLVQVSDELSKLDALTESVIKKTCQSLKEVMEASGDKVQEYAIVNGGHRWDQRSAVPSALQAYLASLRVDLMRYVTKFQWDKAKYPTALPLCTLADLINKEISQVETELRSRATAYSSLAASLQSLERNLNGNLQTQSLSGIIRKEDLVVSEYLTTILVVVSREKYLQWERSYEFFSEFVVPRSSRKIFEDRDGGIFLVTLFKRAVNEFKAKAQESKFIVREYSFDVEERKQQEITKLTLQKKEQYGIFVRWLKVNFTQVFVAWIHLKALRVFVESVLRYGLPVNYQAFLLETDRKHSKKLKEELSTLFGHLDPTASMKEVKCDIPGLCQQEYSSYICFHISTIMLESGEQTAS